MTINHWCTQTANAEGQQAQERLRNVHSIHAVGAVGMTMGRNLVFHLFTRDLVKMRRQIKPCTRANASDADAWNGERRRLASGFHIRSRSVSAVETKVVSSRRSR